jgi:chemotaxis protein histidine kinase CheA/ActR/RegA family two-component response regulator
MLDPSSLDLINREVRNCFLYEDVPDYLAALEENIQLLSNENNLDRSSISSSEKKSIYRELMRIAHSLKGGAGIAQLHNLSRLAHQLENLIEAIEQEQIQDLNSAHIFLHDGVELITVLVAAALQGGDEEETKAAQSLTIFQELEHFLEKQIIPQQEDIKPQPSSSNTNLFLLKTALEVDLEECLQKVEVNLDKYQSPEKIANILKQFIEEGTLLGQVLKLDWLVEAVEGLEYLLEADFQTLSEMIPVTIAYLRDRRSQVLNPLQPEPEQKLTSEKDSTESTFIFNKTEDTGVSLVFNKIEDIEGTFVFNKVEDIEGTFVFRKAEDRATILSSPNKIPEHKFKMSVSRLNRINNTFGELLINYERLTSQQKQLKKIDRGLKKHLEQFNPVNDKVQRLYDRLTTENFTTPSPLLSDRNDEYDVLEFDRYTDFHSSLQNLQDLMMQVHESRTDLDLLSREIEQSLDTLRSQLNSLHGELTESRFVPFRFLAEQFVNSLPNLNRKYNKSVELKIEGENVPIDRLILEQLQTPLTHLFRNSFDHGMETTEERININKPPTGKITFSARIEGNRIVISIADDGRGIDLNKVYQKAVAKGLCDVSIDKLSPTQILEFLFTSGFSTTDKVTDLSGRGVGLDVVHLSIERLRGFLEIETTLGVGTKFTVAVPLSLSILPLLLCGIQQKTLAIPSAKVIEIVSIADLVETKEIFWRDRLISLYSLTDILPYQEKQNFEIKSSLALILDVAGVPIAFAIDRLIEEKELLIKPFDNTVKVPSYVMGCTILGTGEVVVVVAPDRLNTLMVNNFISEADKNNNLFPQTRTISVLIVDDSIAVRRLLNNCLCQSGYQVTQAIDGREALTILDRKDAYFDLVISDLEMPNLDGFGLLDKIRSHSRWYDLPVAILTSRHNQLHHQQAKDLGASAYFNKPFHPNELLKAIEKLLLD